MHNVNAHFTRLYRSAFNLIFIVCCTAAAVEAVDVVNRFENVLNARTLTRHTHTDTHRSTHTINSSKSTFKSHSSNSNYPILHISFIRTLILLPFSVVVALTLIFRSHSLVRIALASSLSRFVNTHLQL